MVILEPRSTQGDIRDSHLRTALNHLSEALSVRSDLISELMPVCSV